MFESTIQCLGKTSKPTAVAERSTTSIFHRPVLAAAFRGLRPSITAVTVDALDKRETADACSG
jgi:hypothetical protein